MVFGSGGPFFQSGPEANPKILSAKNIPDACREKRQDFWNSPGPRTKAAQALR